MVWNILFIIFTFALLYTGVKLLCLVKDNDTLYGETLVLAHTVLCVLFGIFLMVILKIDEPTALDVYCGKTELLVNKTMLNDSIVTYSDSIVVFKNDVVTNGKE